MAIEERRGAAYHKAGHIVVACDEEGWGKRRKSAHFEPESVYALRSPGSATPHIMVLVNRPAGIETATAAAQGKRLPAPRRGSADCGERGEAARFPEQGPAKRHFVTSITA
jgi:hypothetical protein